MDRAKRERRPVRSQITRILNEVEAELAKPEQDHRMLRMKYDKLSRASEQIQEIDQRIRDAMLDADCTNEEQDQEFVDVEEYEDKIRNAKSLIDSVLDVAAPSSRSPSEAGCTATSCSEKRNFKLPKIELKKFDGELKSWLGWWAQFSKIHEDESLHVTDKFQYLLLGLENNTEARDLVESYPQSAENYPQAVEALKERCGDENLLVQVYIRDLLKMGFNNVNQKDKTPFTTMYIKLKSNLRSLQSFKLATMDPSTWLFPLVESSLPVDMLRAWQRSPLSKKDGKTENPPKTTLDYLMEFCDNEIAGEQRIQLAQSSFELTQEKTKKAKSTSEQVSRKYKEEQTFSTAAGLHVGGGRDKCLFCEKSHPSHECFKAIKMSFAEKKKHIKENNRCLSCLKGGHRAEDCKSFVKCTGCGQRHYHLMCPDNKMIKKEEHKQQDIPATTSASNQVKTGLVLLMTVRAKINENIVRILFDSGSQRSYVTTSAANAGNCKVTGKFMERNRLFGGILIEPEERTIYQVPVTKLNSRNLQILKLSDKPMIASHIPKVPKGPWLQELKRKKIWINDFGSDGENQSIDVLIGADLWTQLTTGKSVKLESGFTAIETVFGWTVVGEVPCEGMKSSTAMAVTSLHLTDATTPQLWDLELLGIRESAENKTRQQKELEVQQHFQETVSRKPDGRYCVTLPWIGQVHEIPSNFNIAEKRLIAATKKLTDHGQYEEYDGIFQQWKSEGFIEEVLGNTENSTHCHYVPHRPVFKPTSKTTPVRPVFDASCKASRHPSLNECLEKGPNLIELIPAVMIRFREGRIGIISDIRKAFQMIEMDERDQNFLRFLWWEDRSCKKIKIFRHKRVVFGVSCSPFILGAVINFHLENVGPEDYTIAKKLKQSLYVDNCVTSVNNTEDYMTFKLGAIKIMEEAKMDLRCWEINIVETSRVGSTECRLDDDNVSQNITEVLGMIWNKKDDYLSCVIPEEEPEQNLSKRSLLSTINKIYDPMGFLAPAMITPKLMLQETWALQYKWDEDLPEDIINRFKRWIQGIKCLSEVKIPRWMMKMDEDSNSSNAQIHVFNDASVHAYATCIFLRTEDKYKQVHVSLLQAKARVAPLKKSTIPRLELLSCLIGSRLGATVQDALTFKTSTFFWTDSTTALAWIQRNDEWGTFVGNRVREICELTKSEDWRHIPGIYNPADFPSRGCTPEGLLKSKWWEGPEWLRLSSSEWPCGDGIIDEEVVNSEKKKSCVINSSNKNIPVISEDPWYAKRFSSFSSTVRVMGWIERFIKACKKTPTTTGPLTMEEISSAEMKLCQLIQEEVFPVESNQIAGLQVVRNKGVIRVRTKLLHREDTRLFREPILLPRAHPVVDRLIREEHLVNGHAGVQFLISKLREKFWIVQTRKTVRKIINSCVTCRRFKEKAPTVCPAPLPENRVKDSRVFEVTGIDLGGHLYLKDGSKVWFVLFTCAVYRAVHLELVKSLNTDSFILSLIRFISRRGRPAVIYSDNGTNFRGAVNLFKSLDWNQIQRETRIYKIQWIFNPPSASWWGGFWERLIRSVKDLIKRMLGHGKLNHIQLETMFCQVEAVINGRPLTYVTEDVQDLIPLTPAVFLQDSQQTEAPESEALNQGALRKKYHDFVELKKELKMRFRSEYLGQLVKFGKVNQSRPHEVGEVVIIANDNLKRMEWPMAKIMELMPGKDGKCRVARVKTAGGELIRPVQRLIQLEVLSTTKSITPEVRTKAIKDQDNEEDPITKIRHQKPKVQEVTTTRYGRAIKKPLRF